MTEENGNASLPDLSSPSGSIRNPPITNVRGQSDRNLQQEASNTSNRSRGGSLMSESSSLVYVREFRAPLHRNDNNYTRGGHPRGVFRPPLFPSSWARQPIPTFADVHYARHNSCGQFRLPQPPTPRVRQPNIAHNGQNFTAHVCARAPDGSKVPPAGSGKSPPVGKFQHESHCEHLNRVNPFVSKQKKEITRTHDQWRGVMSPDGQFMKKEYMDQVLQNVPNAKILLAQKDYTRFQYDLEFDFERPSILEMYDFCPCLLTVDIQEIFKEYKDCQIKWVNDTHLLLIFRTAEQAALALETPDRRFKLRRITDGCLYSKFIAVRDNIVEQRNKE